MFCWFCGEPAQWGEVDMSTMICAPYTSGTVLLFACHHHTETGAHQGTELAWVPIGSDIWKAAQVLRGLRDAD